MTEELKWLVGVKFWGSKSPRNLEGAWVWESSKSKFRAHLIAEVLAKPPKTPQVSVPPSLREMGCGENCMRTWRFPLSPGIRLGVWVLTPMPSTLVLASTRGAHAGTFWIVSLSSVARISLTWGLHQVLLFTSPNTPISNQKQPHHLCRCYCQSYWTHVTWDKFHISPMRT